MALLLLEPLRLVSDGVLVVTGKASDFNQVASFVVDEELVGVVLFALGAGILRVHSRTAGVRGEEQFSDRGVAIQESRNGVAAEVVHQV